MVGLALSCLEIVLEGYKWYRTAGEQEKLFPLTWPQTKRALILFVVLLLWSLGLNTLGFLVSSVLAMCVVAVYFDPNKTRRNIIRDILVCVIIGVLVYFMFGYLEVHYPRALLI